MKASKAPHPADCDCCTFKDCLHARCQHPEHQRVEWVENEGESPERRALRRMIYESGVTPVELACLGFV